MKLLIVLLCCLLTGCVLIKKKGDIQMGNDAQWEAANQLFKRDPYWMGSDDAYSIKLNDNRILWLFGDTLIANEKGNRNREADNTYFINNTIGVSEGLNPAKSKIDYYWNLTDNNKPESLFISPLIPEKNWLWPGNGIVIDNKYLVIFFMDIKPIDTGWGFDIDGWQAVLVRNYKDNPGNWNLEWLKPSAYKKFKVMLGSGGVLVKDNYLYAFGPESGIAGNKMFLARWSVKLFDNDNPDLSNPEWWCGDKQGWILESNIKNQLADPEMVWGKGQNEFTVNKFPGEDFYIMTQFKWIDDKVGNADLVCRTSKSLTGPWSKQYTLYKNLYRVEDKPEDLNVYAGKLHPELTDDNSDDLIFTYATNTQKLETLWDRNEIYYPRFLKLSKAKVKEIISK
jgi:hypothetical protein